MINTKVLIKSQSLYLLVMKKKQYVIAQAILMEGFTMSESTPTKRTSSQAQNLKTKENELILELQVKNKQINQLTKGYQSLEKDNNNQRKEIETLKQEIKKFNIIVAQSQPSSVMVGSQMEEEVRNKPIDEQILKYQSDVNKLIKQVKKLRKQRDQLQNKLKNNQSDLDDLLKQNDKLHDRLEQSQSQLSILVNLQNDMITQKSKILQDKESLNRELEQQKQQNGSLKSKLQNKNNQIKQISKSVELFPQISQFISSINNVSSLGSKSSSILQLRSCLSHILSENRSGRQEETLCDLTQTQMEIQQRSSTAEDDSYNDITY